MSHVCGEPSMNVDSAEECEVAALALEATYKTCTNGCNFPIPSGCVADSDRGLVWFNTRENGPAQPHRVPVCKSEQD